MSQEKSGPGNTLTLQITTFESVVTGVLARQESTPVKVSSSWICQVPLRTSIEVRRGGVGVSSPPHAHRPMPNRMPRTVRSTDFIEILQIGPKCRVLDPAQASDKPRIVHAGPAPAHAPPTRP